MNDLEALMWRGERHPEFSSVGVVLEILDSVPDWDRFREAHAWGTTAVPRLRQRVVEPILPLGPPAWVDDPEFDLDYHLRRARLPEPAGMRELLDAAQLIAETPMDRTRPLWTGTLIENLEGGRAAYLLLAHHCMMDGAATIHLFANMHSNTAEPSSDKPDAEVQSTQRLDPWSLTGDYLIEGLRDLPATAARALVSAGGALAHPRHALEFVGSLRRVLSPPAAATPSPLQAQQSGRAWRYGVLECSLADIKAAGRAVGGSVNDAYMAALLGGVARYHHAKAIPLNNIPVVMPVSIRRPDDLRGGNKFAGAFFAGPAGDADPADRIAAVRGASLAVRGEPALDFLGAVSPVLSRIPFGLLRLLLGKAAPRVDLSGSNVPGLNRDVYAAGARVDKMFVFGPLPGVSMMATMISHSGTCCIGMNVDGAVYTDTETLWNCMQEGLDEVLELGQSAPTKTAKPDNR
jgi:WS/DGAT/MGAT family acyltransferase